MDNEKMKVQKNWRVVVILSLILFTIILGQDIVREAVVFRDDVKDLETTLNNQIHDEIKQEVDQRVTEIESITSTLDENHNDYLHGNLVSLQFAVDRTLELNSLESSIVKEDEIIETISAFNDIDTLHSYFLMMNDGTLLFDGELNVKVDVDAFSLQDSFSRFYINDLVGEIEESESGEGFVNAYFTTDTANTQLGFMGFQIDNTDYIIYTIGNMNEYLENQISDYYETLSDYYSTKDNTLFVFGFNDIVYLQRNSDYIGMAISDIQNDLVRDSFNFVIQKSEEFGTGYFTKEFYANNEDGELTKRLVYIASVDELEIVVGYSADSQIYNQLISDFQRDSLLRNVTILVPTYLVIIIIGLIVGRIVKSNNKLSMKLFKEEEELYRTFSDITEDIILITDKKGNIIFANKLGTKTIFKNDELTALNLDDIMVDEEAYKVLIGINENYYIKYSVSKVIYGGSECDLYIVNDVTEKVTTERKLEVMTMSDDMTGLGNRRLMVRDYTDNVLPNIKDGNSAYLAMIDLDNFKQANDDYGHSFGDDVLAVIGDIFKSNSSEDITVYRIGGDEFALLALNKSQNDVLQILRKMKNKVSTHNYGKSVNLGFSAGLIEINIKGSKRRLSDYYEQADNLLYKAKEEGKDKIKV